MKKQILLFVTLVLSLSGFSQNLEQLKVATKKIYDANYNMDFEAVLNLTYPKIVEQSGKIKFLDKLDTDYQNEKYRMRLQLVSPVFQYGPVQTIDGKVYCIVSYKNPVRYFFENKLDSNTSLIEANFLREKDQSRDVTFEPNRNSFNVRRISKLIAIADESTKNEWKFINLDDVDQRTYLKSILDDVIKKQLGL